MDVRLSLPCARAVAIIRDKPKPPSHADRERTIRGDIKGVEVNWLGQRLMKIKIVNIIASRHRRAERRWVR